MNARVIAACVATTLFAQPVAAEFLSGNDLERYARAYDRHAAGQMAADDGVLVGMFLGYVIGAADAVNGVEYCPPRGTTIGQTAAIVRKWMRTSPEVAHHTADLIVAAALANAYPCPRQGRGSGA